MLETTPLITAGAVVTLVTLVIALLRTFGIPITVEQEVLLIKITAIVSPWIIVWYGHHKTTPLANPKAADGEKLVRVSGNQTPPKEKVTRSLD